MNRETLRQWAGFALLAVLVAMAWANGLTGEFTYDDKLEVVGNRVIRFLENWKEILAYNASRPVVIFSWALDWQLWGMNPVGYHLTNVAIHAINAGLLMGMGHELGRRIKAPNALLLGWIMAALWALHPMTTEAVTYITGRSESLATLFYVGSVLEWLRWRREGGPFHLLLSFLSFTLGMATKEISATIPMAIILLEWIIPAPDHSAKRANLAILPFLALLLAGLVFRKLQYGVIFTDQWIRPPLVQLATEMQVICRYLGLWLVPMGQTILHDHPAARGMGDPYSLAAGLLLLTMLASIVWLRRREPGVAAGLAWFLLVLLPSSSFVPLKETMAEHRAYLAGFGLCMATVFALRSLVSGKPYMTMAVLTLSMLGLGTATHERNQAWSTETTLWKEATRRSPDSSQAWYGYGDVLRFAKRFQESMDAYRRALELDPDYLDAYNNLGIALAELGRSEEAKQVWRSSLKRHPTYCKAHNNLAWLYYRQKKWDEAITEFESALLWCPGNVQANYGLGNIYYGPRRDVERAVSHYQAVIQADPHFLAADLIRERLLELTW